MKGFSQIKCQILNDNYRIVESRYDTIWPMVEFANLPENLNDGQWKQLYLNDCIRSKVTFRNNKINGDIFVYWPNGNIMYKCFFVDGKAYSNWCFYASDGVIQSIFYYSKGKFLKKSKSFNQFGKLYQVIYYNSENLNDIKKIKTKKNKSHIPPAPTHL